MPQGIEARLRKLAQHRQQAGQGGDTLATRRARFDREAAILAAHPDVDREIAGCARSYIRALTDPNYGGPDAGESVARMYSLLASIGLDVPE